MTTDKQRLFIAITVPSDRLSALADTIAALKTEHPDARFTEAAHQHVTLKFLGWLEPARVTEAIRLGEEVARDHAPFELSLTEVGAFPSLRRARVVWVGISDPSGSCSAIAADLDRGASSFGVRPEERDFSPHLTLARFKRPRRIEEVTQVDERAQRSFEVSELVLFRSHLSSKGARYEVCERFPLG